MSRASTQMESQSLDLQARRLLLADAGASWRRYGEANDRARELIVQAREHLRAQATQDAGAEPAACRPARWLGLAKAQLRLGLALCALEQAESALATYVEASEAHASFLAGQVNGVSTVRLLKRQSTGLVVGHLLDALPPDMRRDDWILIGQAVKAEMGDGGFQLFDAFSKRSEKYNADETVAAWADIKVGLPALFGIAEGHGFKKGRAG